MRDPSAWYFERLSEFQYETAIISDGWDISYGGLLGLIDLWDVRLSEHGIVVGSVVSVRGDYDPVTCALILALIRRESVVVPLSLAVESHWKQFECEVSVEYAITLNGEDWQIESRQTEAHPLIHKLRQSGEPGLILFSSGTTGKNKAALHSFARLLEKFKVRRHKYVTLTFLLIDHIGGLNTLFYTLSNGGTVVATRDRDPDRICELIEHHSIELLPTSPTFLNLLLLTGAHLRHNLSSLSLITYGTEPMPEQTLQRLHKALPGVRLLQTYGLSELGILRSKSKANDSLWVKVGGEGFETKIVDGTLWIRAESAMLGYLNADDPFDDEGWFNTGDVVESDGEYYRIVGRKSEFINVGGAKVHPTEIEEVLLQIDGVEDALVTAMPNALLGQVPTATVRITTNEDLRAFRARMRAYCRPRLAAYKLPFRVTLTDERLHGARYKKDRKQRTG